MKIIYDSYYDNYDLIENYNEKHNLKSWFKAMKKLKILNYKIWEGDFTPSFYLHGEEDSERPDRGLYFTFSSHKFKITFDFHCSFGGFMDNEDDESLAKVLLNRYRRSFDINGSNIDVSVKDEKIIFGILIGAIKKEHFLLIKKEFDLVKNELF